MPRAPHLTSSVGLLAMLEEDEKEIKAHALVQLDRVVPDFWAEISESLPDIESLYEDDEFPQRQLAALVASKVYYYLGAPPSADACLPTRRPARRGGAEACTGLVDMRATQLVVVWPPPLLPLVVASPERFLGDAPMLTPLCRPRCRVPQASWVTRSSLRWARRSSSTWTR